MPFRCSYCDNVHCETHRLPESHTCHGAQKAAQAARERRRTGHPGVEVQGGGWTGTARQQGGPSRSGFASGSLGPHEGNITKYLLVAIGVVWLVENVVLLTAGRELFDLLFVLDPNWLTKPWTLVTSVLSHAPLSIGHILFNGIVLFFFGPLLEKRIGSRRFLYLVLGGGALAGLAQVMFYATFLGSANGVLGISGGLMAVMGVLTLLGPRLRVLVFFFIPAPLWILTVGYAALSVFGVLAPGGSVAHMAHLSGLVLGLVVGKVFRDRGYAFPGHVGNVRGGMQTGW